MLTKIFLRVFGKYLFSLEQYPYLYSLTILVTFYVISRIFVFVFEKSLLKWSQISKTKEPLIANKIKGPISAILLLIGLRLAIVPLSFEERLLMYTSGLVSSLIVIFAAIATIRFFDILIDNWRRHWAARMKTKVDKNVIGLFQKISRLTIWLIALLFILNVWGIKTAPLLASLGVAGIAVAFALQSTLGNLFGGVSLIVDKTVQAGDVIQIDPETRGVVLDVGLRSTRIRSFDNEIIVVPNGTLANSKILNYAQPDPSARLVIQFGVEYGSDVKKVKKVVLDALHTIEGLKEDRPPYVRFVEMGDSALIFKAYLWVEDYLKRFQIKDIANTKIYNALTKAKIGIPFPQMDVHLKK